MDQKLNNLILDALSKPKDAVFFSLSIALRDAFPKSCIVEVESSPFEVERFSSEGHCDISDRTDFTSQWTEMWWDEHHTFYRSPLHTWRIAKWEGHEIEILTTGVGTKYERNVRDFVVAESADVAREFIEAVCVWCSEVRGEILVFQDGCWDTDKDLFEAIQSTTLSNLILAEGLLETVLAEMDRFLGSRELFDRYNLPWKRGFLFMGPPGNGKTHLIKGLVNHFKLPCLYVRNFSTHHGTDEACIRSVFRRARATAPCLLVLEDLDAMLTDKNRSFFLNELDGFQANQGLLTLATTNHPERLDPAILSRPSRFDRKFTFSLPALSERRRFLKAFGDRFEPELRLTPQHVDRVAMLTEEYSFAYLKELYISSIMEWIALEGDRPIEVVMTGQTATLAQEMLSGVKDYPLPGASHGEDHEDAAYGLGRRR